MSKFLLLTSLLLMVLLSLAPLRRRMLTCPTEPGLRGFPPRRLGRDPRISRDDSRRRRRRRRPPRLRCNAGHELDRAPELQLQGPRRRCRGTPSQRWSRRASERRVLARRAGLERWSPAVRQLGPPGISQPRGGKLDLVRVHGLDAGTCGRDSAARACLRSPVTMMLMLTRSWPLIGDCVVCGVQLLCMQVSDARFS